MDSTYNKINISAYRTNTVSGYRVPDAHSSKDLLNKTIEATETFRRKVHVTNNGGKIFFYLEEAHHCLRISVLYPTHALRKIKSTRR